MKQSVTIALLFMAISTVDAMKLVSNNHGNGMFEDTDIATTKGAIDYVLGAMDAPSKDQSLAQSKTRSQTLEDMRQKLEKEDDSVIQESQNLIDQTKRNIAQGEIGRAIGDSKIQLEKQNFHILKANFDKEFSLIKEQAEVDQISGKATPESIEKQIQALSSKASLILASINVVGQMENEVKNGDGIPEAGIETKLFQDDDLMQTQKAFRVTLNQAVAFQQEFRTAYENKAIEAAAKIAKPKTEFANYNRTKEEKDEMKAFLTGQSS